MIHSTTFNGVPKHIIAGQHDKQEPRPSGCEQDLHLETYRWYESGLVAVTNGACMFHLGEASLQQTASCWTHSTSRCEGVMVLEQHADQQQQPVMQSAACVQKGVVLLCQLFVQMQSSSFA